MYTSVANLYTPEAIAKVPAGRVVDVHFTAPEKREQAKKRVAAYCRVSTDSDEQLGSLENQMDAFRRQVALHGDWELVNIYMDEGISGTSAKRRAGFQQMIADCKAGRIDYIITKSISRFARNTMDCLNYVRELQALGVELFFEKEGIDTADSYSEMLLTVMAAFAQEESRSISENVKWGIRKRFEEGRETRVPIYGYRHTDQELYIIVPEEAAIVKEVFTRYAHGETPSRILKDLIDRNVPPPAGDSWKLLQLARMLHNEKYTGDVVLQKHYVESHLTHKEVKNRGEVPLYHIHNAHPAIIDRRLFAQAAAVARMRQVKTGNSSYPYDRMLNCPRCGETLIHGSLYPVYFGGRQVLGGGWGCYGPRGCGHFLMLQPLLDEAMLTAYREKYGQALEQVDYYWLDELVEKITFEADRVSVLWRDGGSAGIQLHLTHGDMLPSRAAEKYNAYLDKVRTRKTKVKGKFTMGLHPSSAPQKEGPPFEDTKSGGSRSECQAQSCRLLPCQHQAEGAGG